LARDLSIANLPIQLYQDRAAMPQAGTFHRAAQESRRRARTPLIVNLLRDGAAQVCQAMPPVVSARLPS
jgi:hypothetical protein